MSQDELKEQLAEAIRAGDDSAALRIALDLIEQMEKNSIVMAEELRKAKVASYFGGELRDYEEDTSRLYQEKKDEDRD